MENLASLLDWVVLAALFFILVALIRVGKSLQGSKKLHLLLRKDLESFTLATEKTQTALTTLEEARKDITRSLGKEKRDIESLKEDLLYLIEQGKVVADKLEGNLHSLRPMESGSNKPKTTQAPSKKDRESLLKSLDNLR